MRCFKKIFGLEFSDFFKLEVLGLKNPNILEQGEGAAMHPFLHNSLLRGNTI